MRRCAADLPASCAAPRPPEGRAFADNRAHGRDERLLVSSFYDGLGFLGRLVRELGGVR
jgi:hypothetical protein